MTSASRFDGRIFTLAAALLAGATFACGGLDESITDDVAGACGSGTEENAFVDAESCAEQKPDTGYVTNLDAREVELTIEADIEVTSGDKQKAPLKAGQFVLTYLRENSDVYIQSLAETYSSGTDQTEWKVGTSWKKWSAMSSSERTATKRFRLTGVNAVVLRASSQSVRSGKSWTAPIPLRPLSLYAEMQRKCEGGDGHIQADNEVYWYVWDPSKSTCTAPKVNATAKVTKLLPKGNTVYPEYNKLYADKTLDAIVFFGAVEDTRPTDYAFTIIRSFESQLRNAGFTKGTAAKGLRYTRVKNGITANIDIYTPNEFEGLGDYAHMSNFYDGVNNHEVVIFNGHSMLGASDVWAKSQLYRSPTKFQVFIYNGCLGYEYYVDPILDGKRSSANVDIVSNVTETPFAIMSQVSSSALALMLVDADKGGKSSWQSILQSMNQLAGNTSFYGVSAARDNTYKPTR
jgi:hypothetical protein